MFHRLIALLPRLITGNAPTECVVMFWLFAASCAISLSVTRYQKRAGRE